MPRLKRSDPSEPGVTRRGSGKGFSYRDPAGDRVTDEVLIERIKALAIPPAWKEVWICPDDNGHIQATGIDDAGRKQYLYHLKWQEKASTRKFDEMLEFSKLLSKLRKNIALDIALDGMPKEKSLACSVRILDLGLFRVGSEQYAEENETYGIATILKEHVTLLDDGGVRFDYPAKGSQDRVQDIHDEDVRMAAEILLRRRSGPDDFLVYRDGKTWKNILSGDINDYIREHTGDGYSAKDFRTWNGTVLAAVELAAAGVPDSRKGRERVINEAIVRVSEQLGNTPAVCRGSYVDPRLLDRFRDGRTITPPRSAGNDVSSKVRARIERQVRKLIVSG